jgi:mono/diheme cytochrome c family protein
MPPWGLTLGDAQLAAALDHALTAWDNARLLPPDYQPFTAADIAAARATPMSPQQVAALRAQLLPAQLLPVEPALAQQPPDFTQDQADQGHAIYRRYCQNCHGTELDNGQFGGAPLVGSYFARHWGSGTLAALLGYLRAKMPPDRPGRLSDQSYLDLAAFLLSRNGFPATATELPPDPEAQEHMSLRR